MSAVLPICGRCSSQTCSVGLVNVTSAVVMRDEYGLKILYRCHGERGVEALDETDTEGTIERMVVFKPW